MKKTNSFKKDLKKGEWAEKQLVPFIENTVKNKNYNLLFNHYSHEITKNKRKLKEYDISFQVHKHGNKMYEENKRVTFEIKTDFYPNETNNLIFETKCNNRKSGVSATKSTFFCYWRPLYLKENIWIMKSKNLLLLLEENFQHTLTNGGDNNLALMYVIPHNEFKEIFIQKGGYLGTYNIPLPDGLETFEEKEKILYYATQMKSYKNPLDWLVN